MNDYLITLSMTLPINADSKQQAEDLILDRLGELAGEAQIHEIEKV